MRTFVLFCLLCTKLWGQWTHLELGAGNYGYQENGGSEQYHILFYTLDELVERYGPIGTFHINDINEEWCDYACEKLREYAYQKGLDRVIIGSIPGDYEFLYLPYPYDSVHLKNPEPSFFNANGNTRELLQKLADYGKTGLYFFPVYLDSFFPPFEKGAYADKGIFYLPTKEWDSLPYYGPWNDSIQKEVCRVFFIESSQGRSRAVP